MIPDWMKKSDDYVPVNDYNTFIKKTLESIGTAMSKIKIQRGHEKIHSLPAIFKLLILLLLIHPFFDYLQYIHLFLLLYLKLNPQQHKLVLLIHLQ